MVVWLITIGEPLPIDQENNRLLRTGMLANILVEQGHKVVWWTSTFDHTVKRHRYHTDTRLTINDRYKIRLLHSLPYKKNLSLARLINHHKIAEKFKKLAKSESKADIILCSFPTIGLSMSASEFGKEMGIPVILDVRDLWPDTFLKIFPLSLMWLGKLIFYRSFSNTKKAFKNCTSIIGVSEAYVRWGLAYAGRKVTKSDAVFPLGYQMPTTSRNDAKASEDSLLEMGVDPSKKICWFIGTFGWTYDLSTIIDAARELEKRGRHEFQFILSGNGERYAEWHERAKGLNNVIFTGWVQSSQIECLLRFSDIGIAAYDEQAPQGLPNKIFEYMCGGLPILSSLRGETEELLYSTACGLSYQPGNVESFIETLLTLKNDSKLVKQMSLNSLALFKERFTSDKIYGRMANYLSEVAGGTSPERQII